MTKVLENGIISERPSMAALWRQRYADERRMQPKPKDVDWDAEMRKKWGIEPIGNSESAIKTRGQARSKSPQLRPEGPGGAPTGVVRGKRNQGPTEIVGTMVARDRFGTPANAAKAIAKPAELPDIPWVAPGQGPRSLLPDRMQPEVNSGKVDVPSAQAPSKEVVRDTAKEIKEKPSRKGRISDPGQGARKKRTSPRK